MKRSTTYKTIGALAIAMIFTLASCAAEGESNGVTIVEEVVDSVAASVAESFAEAAITPTVMVEAIPAVAYGPSPEPVTAVSQVAGIVSIGSRTYGVFDGGVAVHDFRSDQDWLIPIEDRLRAIAVHEGVVYVGGADLYTIADSTVNRVNFDGEGTITCLYSYGLTLMIGTECGLYARGILGKEKIFEDGAVTAMVEDMSGLWIGTRENGLFRWDGDTFKERYMLRDPDLFSSVHTLDFRHHHLYVGTTNGLHVFDGGRWETLTTLEGLPSNNVKSVDASAWVVYVGTDEGVVSFFNGEITPIAKLENQAVNDIALRGRKLLAATDDDGILMKSGYRLKTIVEPQVAAPEELVSIGQ